MPPVGPDPSGDDGRDGRDGRGRRRALVAVAVAVVVLVAAVAAALAARGDDDADSATPTDTTATEDSTTSSSDLTTTSTTGATTTTGAVTTEAPAVTNPPVTTAPPMVLPTDPNAYAVAAFEAWQQGDRATLELLTSPGALAVLEAHPPGTAEWSGPVYEGAAGSTYCTWTGPEEQLILRIANEAASTGQAHAVRSASFEAVPG